MLTRVFEDRLAWLLGASAATGGVLLAVVPHQLDLPYWTSLAMMAVVIVLIVGVRMRSYRLLSFTLFALIALNLATYSFLRFLEGGQVGALLRLPLLVGPLALALLKVGDRAAPFLYRNWDVLLFGAVAVLSGALAFDPGTGFLYGSWIAAALVFLLVYLHSLRSTRPPGEWLRACAWILLLAGLPSVLLALGAIPGYGGMYLDAKYSSSTFYAFVTPMVTGAVLYLMHVRDRSRSGVLARTVVPAAAGLLLTGCAAVTVLSGKRVALAALLGVILIYVFLLAPDRRRLGRSAVQVGVALAALAVLGSYAGSSAIVQWKLKRAAENSEYYGDRSRYLIYTANFQLWQESPALGVGPANAGPATEAKMLGGEFSGYSPHSTYVGVLSEMGLAGLLALLLVLARSFRTLAGIPDRKTRNGLLLLLFPLMLISVTEYNLTPGQALFWPLWLMILLPRAFAGVKALPAAAEAGR